MTWVPESSPSSSVVEISGSVANFLAAEQPRAIELTRTVSGVSHVIFDEDAEGTVNTKILNQYGDPLGGPPLQEGDSIKIQGREGENGELIADVIWLMDTDLQCQR
ncbi:MAG: hypothetical protein KDJ65_36600 [Anaerolineae bacterium]|nr:hypothetical protein [Anaerolineae bacterium]